MKVRTETVWRTEADPDRVWETLADYARWPTWWSAIRSVELLDPGDRRGVGSRLRQSWSGRVPVPITFDLTPSHGDQPQLTFGSGIHYCLGQALARAELQEALPLLARRMPNLRRAGEIEWKPEGVGIFGPAHFPVTFDAGH